MNILRSSNEADREHQHKLSRPLTRLGGLLVLASIVLVLMMGCGGNGRAPLPPSEITLPQSEAPGYKRIEPNTKYLGTAALRKPGSVSSDQVPAVDREQAASEIQFYVDLSHPIAGFVSPSDPNESHFPAMIDAAGREMLAVFGTGGIPVRWYGFTDQVRSLGQRPRIARPLFDGGQSDLTKALEKAQRDLESGVTDAAVFLTDLMVTRDGFASPIHLPNFLAPWMESAGVEDGQFDLAIVGAKLEYWGVQHRTCPASGELGCWYNERTLSYVGLNSVVWSPVYLLILAERTGDDRARELALRIENALVGLIETDESDRIQSELLTELAAVSPDSLVIEAQNRPTLQLDTGAANLTLWCVDPRPATLLAKLTVPLEGAPSVVSDMALISGSWDRDRLSVTINCREVRDVDSLVTTGVRIQGPLDDDEWNSTQNQDWESWQAADYTPTGTVQLLDALNRLRVVPNQVTLDLTRLFTFPNSKD